LLLWNNVFVTEKGFREISWAYSHFWLCLSFDIYFLCLYKISVCVKSFTNAK
jgi:hypothetical protein